MDTIDDLLEIKRNLEALIERLRIGSKASEGGNGLLTPKQDSNVPTTPSRPSVAIVVGHSRRGDQGAVATDDATSEWVYNNELAWMIQDHLPRSIHSIVVDTIPENTYTKAVKYLSKTLNPLNLALVVELHFNSGPPHAQGYEIFHWASSTKGKQAAKNILHKLNRAFPNNINRGTKQRNSTAQRGGRFLKELNAPALILEPFFGSSEKEWKFFKNKENKTHLAKAIASGITSSVTR